MDNQMEQAIKELVREHGAAGYYTDKNGLIGIEQGGLIVWHRYLGAGVLPVSGTSKKMKSDVYQELVIKNCQQKCNDRDYDSKLPWVSYKDKGEKSEAWQARHDDEMRLMDEFWKDLDEYCGITEAPVEKVQKLHSIAWDFGHSAGLGEVLYYADELAELIK